MKFPTISNEEAAHLKQCFNLQDEVERDLVKAFGIKFVNMDDYLRTVEKQLGPALREIRKDMLDG